MLFPELLPLPGACAAGMAVDLDTPKILGIIVFAGSIAITFPALLWMLRVN